MTVKTEWQLYLLDCDGRLYTGISTDPARRLEEHRAGKSRGARFTRGSRQLQLIWQVHVGNRSLAQAAEHRLRRLPRDRKLAIAHQASDWEQLSRLLFPER